MAHSAEDAMIETLDALVNLALNLLTLIGG